MIKSFADRETETIITRQRSGTLPPDIRQIALRQQHMLYSDRTPSDRKVSPDDLHNTRVETGR